MTRIKSPAKADRRWAKQWLPLLLFSSTLLLIGAVHWLPQSLPYRFLEQLAFIVGDNYQRWFEHQRQSHPAWLIGLSFLGGLVASISPCILSLLPVNLTYIGTREITSRQDAVVKAGSFVLGVVTVLSMLGMFSSLAGIVFVQFRGYFYLLVGTIIVLMGLSLAGLVRLPMPQLLRGPAPAACCSAEPRSLRTWAKALITGPYGVGLTFALISSPCTSPVLIAVLTAGATTGSQFLSLMMMVSYSLGYTAIIFLASLFTGLAKQTRGLLTHSETITRVASTLLVVIGGFYLVSGGHWVVGILTAR